jgi:predicted nucleic-acid-binding Zn-ribbon protein
MLLGGVIMKDANCPKCGSGEVYSGVELIVKDGPIASILKGGPFASNSIPISLSSMAPIDNYVCVNCGYVEHYISDRSKLKEIAKKWDKASVDKSAVASDE